MDEPTLLPVLEKKKKPPKKTVDGQRLWFLVVGVVLGSGVVLATVGLMGQPKERIVYRSDPAQQSAPVINPKTTAPAQLPDWANTATPPATKPAPDKSTETPKGPAVPTTGAPSGPDKSMHPFNPLSGGFSMSMPPKEITGEITPTTHPGAANTEITPDETSAPRGLLVTMRLGVGDPNSALRAMQAIAAKAGGSAIEFDESATKDDPEGALLFVPAAKATETEKQIGSAGSLIASDSWNGSSSDRLDRIEVTAQNHISDLHVQKQELLVKYFEDAPQIKRIDEMTDRISKSLTSLRGRKPGAATAVFKVKFVG